MIQRKKTHKIGCKYFTPTRKKFPNTALTQGFLPSAPKAPQRTRRPRPKPKPTPTSAAPWTERGKCVGPGEGILTVHLGGWGEVEVVKWQVSGNS